MNRKTTLMLVMLGLFIPALAADKAGQPAPEAFRVQDPMEYPCHCPIVDGPYSYRHEDPVRKEMDNKQMPQKLEKLVAEYDQLEGKKQEAKKVEIAAEVSAIRDTQLKDMQKRTENIISSLKFQQENTMSQEELQKFIASGKAAQEPAAKQAWVEEKAEQLIAADGDVKVLFGKPCDCWRRPKKMAEKQHKRLKATEEKMKKLVTAYKKAKGKKQEAKRAEIVKEVTAIREAQLEHRQRLDEGFAKRIEKDKEVLQNRLHRAEEMQERIKQKQAEKQSWVNKKTDELIEAKGDLKVLFDREGRPEMKGPRGQGCPKMGGKECPMHKFHKGHKFHKDLKKGEKGFPKGPGKVGLLPPPPPPPAEEK